MQPRWLTGILAFSLLLLAGIVPASAGQADAPATIQRDGSPSATRGLLAPTDGSTDIPPDRSLNPAARTGREAPRARPLTLPAHNLQAARDYSPDLPSRSPQPDWTLSAAPTADGRRIPRSVTVDPNVQNMLGQVRTGTLYQYMEWLTGEEAALVGGMSYVITTRNTDSGTPIQKATQFVYEQFDDLGLVVEYDYWDETSNPNVIATKPGLENPDEIYVMCAHLDDLPSSGIAPGADDNASGSTAVLVAADILSQYDFGCTLKFALWTGEEQGLLGSEAWAATAQAQNLNIKGVLNLDMIGYNSDDQYAVDLHAQSSMPESVAIAEVFAGVNAAYTLRLSPEILIDNSLGNQSDNASFWAHDYPAILAIEDGGDFNWDNYHQVTDRLSTLDKMYFTRFVQASVGTLVHMSDCLLCTPVEVLTVTTDVQGCVARLQADLAGTVPVTYTWDLGSHGIYTVPSPTVPFEAGGTYPYTLTVSNCEPGPSDTATGTVTVACVPPTQRTYLPLVVRGD